MHDILAKGRGSKGEQNFPPNPLFFTPKKEGRPMNNDKCCANCDLRRTLKTIKEVIVAHKCIQNDEFITDFARCCPYWEEMKPGKKDRQEFT